MIELKLMSLILGYHKCNVVYTLYAKMAQFSLH